jgi:hypothetical protein
MQLDNVGTKEIIIKPYDHLSRNVIVTLMGKAALTIYRAERCFVIIVVAASILYVVAMFIGGLSRTEKQPRKPKQTEEDSRGKTRAACR